MTQQGTTIHPSTRQLERRSPTRARKIKRFYSSLAQAFSRRTKRFSKFLSGADEKYEKKPVRKVHVAKADHNPILRPVEHHDWESIQTFNAAAFERNGAVHFFYRALGSDYVSRIGYATSRDGLFIDTRLPYPVYSIISHDEHDIFPTYDSLQYSSGGGWAGCEDPRVTFIDDRLYMFYVAFDGRNMPRIAMTSIAGDDIDNHVWNWMPAQIISQPGVVDKSGVLFPEKVNGKYVIMHRIFPDILIDFVDTLDFPRGTYLKGEYRIKIRPGEWDSRKIGAGAPPLKTKHGWLLIYYGVDEKDASKYKMGAMLLDLHDPTKVLYRSDHPIVEPSHWYENEGHKAGIVYPCGALIKDDKLIIYYGGADTVVCAAYADLETFLHQLMDKKQPVLQRMLAGLKKTFSQPNRLDA